MAVKTLPTYDHTCRQCGEQTTFEYSSGPYAGNGWDEASEGAEDFAIVGERQCLNAASVADEVCDAEDVCTLTAEQFDTQAYDDFCSWWYDQQAYEKYNRGYDG